jgi:hypothetical protein
MKDIIQNKIKEFNHFGFVNERTGRMDEDADTPRELRDWITQALTEAISQTKQEVYKEAYKLGVNNALNMISACYSPQSENYNKEVIDDITKTRKFLFSTPQKNIQECKQNPQSVVIDKKICKCFEKDSKHWCIAECCKNKTCETSCIHCAEQKV